MNNKSIFKKQLMLYLGTFFVSFVILGAALSAVYTKYYMNEMKQDLINQGRKVSEEYTKAYFTGDFQSLAHELQMLEEYMSAGVFFINSDGVLILGSPGIPEKWIGQAVTNQKAIEGILNGNIVTLEGKINGLFEEPVLTVGYPLQVGQMAGIFMCTSMPEIERSLHSMYFAGFICLLAVMVMGTILVYIFSKKITQPLLQMNEAAKVIAKGDFEQRVEICTDDEVGQLAESFNHMAENLHQYEKNRRDFIANVSHDLRSPLTSIQGFLSAILDGTIPEEKQSRYLNIILEETQRLTKLTNDIVDLSMAQTSKMTLNKSDFDINALIRETLERMEARFLEKEIVLRVIYAQKETYVLADRDKIARVLYNLIDNAIKFSYQKGEIEIETVPFDFHKIMVIIRDFGKGISKEEQKCIFDRFYKADASRGEDKNGSGLGLSIVKEFLLAHGEHIAVKSEPDKATEFIFSLPLAERNPSK
ncbi:MAG: HAMP domain-containing histidine kinase [Epulopiscium sp.]|jgi:signal transduction histidine kinase|nr:HAMP domain-containing histidine kinase [Candidatus Epulonipiscium sp.]